MLLGDAVTGMQAIVTQLTTGITASTIFSVVGDVMPFVITMIPIALRTLHFEKSYKTVLVKQRLSFNT